LNELLDEEDDGPPDDLLELNHAFVKEILRGMDESLAKSKESDYRIMLDIIAFVFHGQDYDGDGEISVEELAALFEKIGWKRPKAGDLYALVDKVNGTPDGKVRYREFVNIMLLVRGVVSSPIEVLHAIDNIPVRTSKNPFKGLLGRLGATMRGPSREIKIWCGQIRVRATVEGPVVRVIVGEAQGLRTQMRGLPSPLAKCYFDPNIDKSVSTAEKLGTANPVWDTELELPLPEALEGVRLCISVMHCEASGMGLKLGVGYGKETFIGMVSFPLSEVAEGGFDGWYRLLDERQGRQTVVPLKKIRMSHRIISTTEDRAAKLEDYTFGKLLGEGGYGKVFLAQENSNKEVYAVKVQNKVALVEMNHEAALIERRVLTIHPPSPFIARLHAAFQTEGHIFMIMEFFHGGDLEGQLIKDGQRKIFSPEAVRFVAGQVLLGLWHLHHLGFMYRDLKPANIMIDYKGLLKLTDFGLSKFVGKEGSAETFVGTPNYMAPEVIRNNPGYEGIDWHDHAPYGTEVDFWSLGVIMKEMLTGRIPWEGAEQRGQHTIFRKVLHEPIVVSPLPRGLKREWVKKCKSVVLRFLERDPRRRMTTEAAVKGDDFFKGFRWDQLGRLKMEPPGRMCVPDLDNFYFVKAGDGKIKLDPVDEADLADIKRHVKFFSGFDFVPGTVEEQTFEGSGL